MTAPWVLRGLDRGGDPERRVTVLPLRLILHEGRTGALARGKSPVSQVAKSSFRAGDINLDTCQLQLTQMNEFVQDGLLHRALLAQSSEKSD